MQSTNKGAHTGLHINTHTHTCGLSELKIAAFVYFFQTIGVYTVIVHTLYSYVQNSKWL